MKLPSISQIRKAIVTVLGVAGMAVASGFLHGRVLLDVEAGIGVVTALLTYLTPNAPAPAGLGAPVFAPDPAAPAAPTVAAPPPVPPAQIGSDPMAAIANSGVAQPPPV